MSEKSQVERDWQVYKLTRARMKIEEFLRSEAFVKLIMKEQEKILKDVIFKRCFQYPPLHRKE